MREDRFYLFYLLPLAAYMAFIIAVSVMPVPPILPEIWNIDKVQHMGAYFVMSALILRLVVYRKIANGPRAAFIAAAAATIFGAAIEVLQSFTPTRFGDVFDAIANAIGAFTGAYLYVFILRGLKIKMF